MKLGAITVFRECRLPVTSKHAFINMFAFVQENRAITIAVLLYFGPKFSRFQVRAGRARVLAGKRTIEKTLFSALLRSGNTLRNQFWKIKSIVDPSAFDSASENAFLCKTRLSQNCTKKSRCGASAVSRPHRLEKALGGKSSTFRKPPPWWEAKSKFVFVDVLGRLSFKSRLRIYYLNKVFEFFVVGRVERRRGGVVADRPFRFFTSAQAFFTW